MIKLLDLLKEEVPSQDYWGAHRPPDKSYGAPLHDLTSMYPDDIYGPDAYALYGDNDDRMMDITTINLIKALRGKPDTKVTVYRAVPKAFQGTSINPGDWVTIHKKYAIGHGKVWLDNSYKILSAKVPAKFLYTEGNSIFEWGYDPT